MASSRRRKPRRNGSGGSLCTTITAPGGSITATVSSRSDAASAKTRPSRNRWRPGQRPVGDRGTYDVFFTPLTVPELCRRFLDDHEHVQRSSLATIRRYGSALQHLEQFATKAGGNPPAHDIQADQFARFLRSSKVAPNGHPHTKRRALRDKGVRFILETCRSLFGWAAKKRHMPPYGENPFAGLGGKRFRIEDAKPIFVFDAETELAFLKPRTTGPSRSTSPWRRPASAPAN